MFCWCKCLGEVLKEQNKHILARKDGAVVQLVRTPACHAGGRGFKSHPRRHLLGAIASDMLL